MATMSTRGTMTSSTRMLANSSRLTIIERASAWALSFWTSLLLRDSMAAGAARPSQVRSLDQIPSDASGVVSADVWDETGVSLDLESFAINQYGRLFKSIATIRIGNAEHGQGSYLHLLHLASFRGFVMIVAEQMKYRMNDEM